MGNEVYSEGQINVISSEITKAESLRDEISASFSGWDENLKKHKKDAAMLEKSLEESKQQYNFVGLYDGFNKLSQTKSTDKDWLMVGLAVMGVLTLLPAIIRMKYVEPMVVEGTGELLLGANLIEIIPYIASTVLFVYFFRVILHNYRSVKMELLQIELRKTLCQFIHNYAKQSPEMKEGNSDAMNKFENLIFSPILGNDSPMPSTYEGMDKLGEILKAFTPKK